MLFINFLLEIYHGEISKYFLKFRTVFAKICQTWKLENSIVFFNKKKEANLRIGEVRTFGE
jgi:hypothetical protein